MNAESIMNALCLAGSAYSDTQAEVFSGAVRIIDDADSGIQCFIQRDADILYITFRGSDSARDWQTNLYFRRMAVPYGNIRSPVRVHSGFILAYKSEKVRKSIHRQIKPDIRKIIITGHSLGGALAVLCAVDVQYNYPEKDIEVYTFGAPRTGNTAFVRSYNKRVFKTFRVQNGNDIVTKLPPAVFGYRHEGIPVHVGRHRLPFAISANQHRPEQYAKSVVRSFFQTSL